MKKKPLTSPAPPLLDTAAMIAALQPQNAGEEAQIVKSAMDRRRRTLTTVENPAPTAKPGSP